MKKQLEKMHKSVSYWITPTVRDNNLTIGDQDIDFSSDVSKRLNWLKEMWSARFSVFSVKISTKFSNSVKRWVDHSVKISLKDVMAVDFEMTDAMKKNVKNIVESNVNLIKSIEEQYFSQITTIALESVTRGRDMQYLSEQLQNQLGVSKRRADFIARDQNDKATVQLSRVRHLELGITKGKWRHSGGGKHPRPKHVKANGEIFELNKGLPVGEGDKYVLPGEEINCRCIYSPVIEGFR